MAWRGCDPAFEIKTVEELASYIRFLNYTSWRPSNFTIHNTGSPTLHQWWHSVPPAQRMVNLRHYYENEMGWSAGPHCFIDGKSWWIFTDFNVKGVHSPSWNGTMLGFEHVGDYSTESATTGLGADVQRMGHELSAICCEFFGWNPENLKFHYEDPATDHACPGKSMQKPVYIDGVRQKMGDAGEAESPEPQAPYPVVVEGVPKGDVLNIRATPSSSAAIVGHAENEDILTVVGEAQNGETRWLRIQVGEDAGAGLALFGWCAASYVGYDQ
jgi:hypothetical protein